MTQIFTLFSTAAVDTQLCTIHCAGLHSLAFNYNEL